MGAEMATIEKFKRDGKYFLTINGGPEMPLDEAEGVLGIQKTTLQRGCQKIKKKKFNKWVSDIQWRMRNKVDLRQRIFICDGKRACTALVARRAGITRAAARLRVIRWQQGKLTTEQLFGPRIEPGFLDDPCAEGDEKEAEPSVPVTGRYGLGPRMKVEDIQGPTPIERQLYNMR